MICRGGVVMGYVLNLAFDDDDDWLTSRPPWSSVPLTVNFILYLDRVFVSFAMLAFAFTTLLLRGCWSWMVTV